MSYWLIHHICHINHVDRVIQVVDLERDSAYFGTTSGDVIKVDDDDDDDDCYDDNISNAYFVSPSGDVTNVCTLVEVTRMPIAMKEPKKMIRFSS